MWSVFGLVLLTACDLASADGNTADTSNPLMRIQPDSFESYLSGSAQPMASALACVRRLPDGARVCINRKCVSALWFDHLFIAESDRSAGIKVVYGNYYPPDMIAPGNLVSFSGVLDTIGGQRVIRCTSDFVADLTADSPVGSLGMSTSSILGWPMNPRLPYGPRYTGLSPIGLPVRIWGRVVSSNLADEDGYFVYVDDGWGKKDGSDTESTGVRVYSDIISDTGQYLAACGILTTKIVNDPTPQGPDGDELVVPAIHTSYDQEPYYPDITPVTFVPGSVTGRVRLVGQAAPGRRVRIYSQYESIVVDGVTDEFKTFKLTSVPPADTVFGRLITASAPGYVSDSRCSSASDTGLEFALQPSAASMEVSASKQSITICSGDSTAVTALLRDCEGKGLAGKQIRLTTSKGLFVGYDSKDVVLDTDEAGLAHVRLTAGPDGSGVASVRAALHPSQECANQADVILRGPEVVVTATPGSLVQAGLSVINAQVLVDGAPVPGALVLFKTDHGTFPESKSTSLQAVADANGNARATLSITSPGTAKVLAIHANSCGHKTVNWTLVSYKSAPWYSQGIQYSNPLIADLYGTSDGKRQVVLVTTSGSLTALNSSGSVLWAKMMHLPGNNTPSCAPVDAIRSERPCIFIPAESQQKVYCFAPDGRLLAGWPAGSNYRFIKVAAAIGDINLDGTPEIVAGDECCYVFSWNPTGDYRKTGTAESSFLWRNLTGSASTTIYGTTTALGDLDNDPDQIPDVILGSNHTTAVFGFEGDTWGDYMTSPVYLDGFPKAAGARVQTSPAIGDIDGDGKNDYALGSDDGCAYLGLSSDGSLKGYQTGGPIKSSPALFDLDDDGKLDVIIGSDSGRLFAFNWLGQAPEGWEQGIKLSSGPNYAIESAPIVGDVTGDGVPEVVVGCNDGYIYAVYKDGMSHTESGEPTGPLAWVRCCIPPAKLTAQVLTAPVIDDLDGDGKVEVLAGSDEGVYVFHFDVIYDKNNPAAYPWPTFHRDNKRSGCVTPLPPLVNASIVGLVTKNGVPVINTKIWIYEQDGTSVYEPKTDPPVVRSWVQTTGTLDVNEVGKGAYCVSQLPANKTYKLRVEAPNEPVLWVENIAVTTGAVRVDIAIP